MLKNQFLYPDLQQKLMGSALDRDSSSIQVHGNLFGNFCEMLLTNQPKSFGFIFNEVITEDLIVLRGCRLMHLVFLAVVLFWRKRKGKLRTATAAFITLS